jgi:hypothetical protein
MLAGRYPGGGPSTRCRPSCRSVASGHGVTGGLVSGATAAAQERSRRERAVEHATSGEGEKAVSDATRAAQALQRPDSRTPRRGCLPTCRFLERDLRAPVAERVPARLAAMGALTSAKDAATYG